MSENQNFLKPHIFRERNKKYGYYDYKKNTLYYLNADNQTQYQVLSLRYVTGFTLGLAVYILMHNAVVALALAAVVILVMELVFRLRFLPSCKTRTNVSLEKLTPCQADGKDDVLPEKRRKRGILLMLLGVLVIMNAYDVHLEGMELLLSLAGGAVCVLFGGVQFLKGKCVQ